MPAEHILAVATALIDAEGADALTLRTLAVRLGSSTATLYRHFGNRAVLIDGVVDGVFGEVDLGTASPADVGWDVALTAMSTSLFEALERHRNVAPLILERMRTTPNIIRIRERVLVHLLASGFSPRHAIYAYTAVGRFVLGFGVQTRLDGRAEGTPLEDLLLPADRYPASAAVAVVGPVSLAEEFQFGLAMLLVGLGTTQSLP